MWPGRPSSEPGEGGAAGGGETRPRPPRAPAHPLPLPLPWGSDGLWEGTLGPSPGAEASGSRRRLQMRERRGGQRQPHRDLTPGDTQFLPKTRELQAASASSPGTWGLAHSHCCSGRVWKSLRPARPGSAENGASAGNTRHRHRVPGSGPPLPREPYEARPSCLPPCPAPIPPGRRPAGRPSPTPRPAPQPVPWDWSRGSGGNPGVRPTPVSPARGPLGQTWWVEPPPPARPPTRPGLPESSTGRAPPPP